jgi:hypothetical protein
MIFGVVFLGDGINTYITVGMKVETDITSITVSITSCDISDNVCQDLQN